MIVAAAIPAGVCLAAAQFPATVRLTVPIDAQQGYKAGLLDQLCCREFEAQQIVVAALLVAIPDVIVAAAAVATVVAAAMLVEA